MALRGSIHFELVGDEEVGLKFKRAGENADDLRTVWRRFSRVLANHNMHQFASEGAWSGTPWPPLKPAYEARKVAMGFPSNPLMRTMHLFWAAVTPGRLLHYAGRNRGEFQIEDKKYVFHHFGAPRAHLPARPIMVATEGLAGELARITLDHIVEPFDGV